MFKGHRQAADCTFFVKFDSTIILDIIARVFLGSNEVLTPFDLRAQIFRVNVELSPYYRGQFFFEK